MDFNQAERYIGELSNTEPWLVDTTHHLHQIFSIPETLEKVVKNKPAILKFAENLDGTMSTMGKGDKASNAEVLAAYARLMGMDAEYSDIAPSSAKIHLACTYSGSTGDLLHRLKLLKGKAKLLAITNRFGPDDAPAGTVYDLCDAVLHQPLPEEENTIVSSMSSFGITFAGIAALDFSVNRDDRLFRVIDVLSERVKLQLSSQDFWNDCLEMARVFVARPSYWLASDQYFGATLKTNINLREQSGLHVCQGLIDDFSHREIGLAHSEGANIVLVDTPDVLDKENFKRSAEMVRKMCLKSGRLELVEMKLRGSFVENLSDIYLKILGAGYMASMLKELDPNASRSFIDKVRSY